jgi:hypothetical protein
MEKIYKYIIEKCGERDRVHSSLTRDFFLSKYTSTRKNKYLVHDLFVWAYSISSGKYNSFAQPQTTRVLFNPYPANVENRVS